jgi:hypothetical protein
MAENRAVWRTPRDLVPLRYYCGEEAHRALPPKGSRVPEERFKVRVYREQHFRSRVRSDPEDREHPYL